MDPFFCGRLATRCGYFPDYLQFFHILVTTILYDYKRWKSVRRAERPDWFMFGYVRIYKPDLKVAEYEYYQGIYCSLCKQLGKRYGLLARMTLSYDFTFLALLRMALDDRCTGFQKGRCAFNPLKKRTCCRDNDHIPFAADAATLLVYYKIKDNLADEGFWKSLPSRFLLPFASHVWKKALKRQPELDEMIRACMEKQAGLERAGTASIDAAAEPTAQMLSGLAALSARDDKERRVLERFGYCLGRWIYLADAVDDLAEDLEKGSYNPYILSRGLTRDRPEELEETRRYSLFTLNACLAECLAAYNLLAVRRFDGILRNVLEQGMPAVQRRILAGKPGKAEENTRNSEIETPL